MDRALYHTILPHTIPSYTIQYHFIPQHTMPFHLVSAIACCVIPSTITHSNKTHEHCQTVQMECRHSIQQRKHSTPSAVNSSYSEALNSSLATDHTLKYGNTILNENPKTTHKLFQYNTNIIPI